MASGIPGQYKHRADAASASKREIKQYAPKTYQENEKFSLVFEVNKSASVRVLHPTSFSVALTITTVVNPDIKAQAMVNIHLMVVLE